MTWGKRRALVILIVILLFAGFIYLVSRQPTRIASNSVLVMDVDGDIQEQRPVDWLGALSGSRIPVQHDYVDSVDAAAGDPRIRGLAVRIGPLDTGWAKLEEIRAHIENFRRSGKPSICYLGYDGIGNREYYLASACQQVWLVPTAPLGIRGMMAEATFLRGTFDKLKIVPDFYHIGDYKTASNQFTEKQFTPAHREEVTSLLNDVYNRYVSEAAFSRGMSSAQFDGLLHQGPFLAREGADKKLVDRLAYWDQVQQFFSSLTGDWTPVDLGRYAATLRNGSGPKIAVIYASGLIVSGDSQGSPAGSMMGGDTVAADLRRARNDSEIRAIVVRVDSGGGSALASEVIRREVYLAHNVKPVVVSMSDVAASGGYWLAMSSDKIVAEPNTLTASIGVLGGKFNIAGLYSLLGLSTDHVATSDNATLESDQQDFTPEQRAYFQKSLQETYQNFIQGVASGRHLSVDAVDRIGKGRVWTGAQAKGLGLVDDLGGLDRAIAMAKDLAHIPATSSVHLVRLPEEKTPWQELFNPSEREMGIRIQEMRQLSQDTVVSPAATLRAAALSPAALRALVRQLLGSDDALQARMPFDLNIR
jgi:protease-4